MKKKHLTNAKKTLSVFLAVLMLMSAWVFVAPEKAEAAAVVSATETYNRSMLNEINTSVDTSVSTTYYKFKIYGNGDDNASYNTTANQNEYYKNVIAHSGNVSDVNTGAYFTGVTNAEQNVSVAYPSMVLKYDGVTTPRFGLLLQGDSGGTMRFQKAWMSAGDGGLTFNPSYWKGVAGNDSAFFYIFKGASEGAYVSAQTDTSGAAFNTRKSGQWEFCATTLEFKGTMSAGEWVRTIKPTWKFTGGATSNPATYTGNTTSTIYVMNFKGYTDLLSQINTKKTELYNNAAQYTPESIRAFVNAAKNIINCNPKNNTTVAQAPTWGSNMTTYYNAYNTAVNGLARRQFEVTYDNMFSLADWRYSQSLGDANYVSVNLNEGKVTIINPNTSEFTTPMSGSSSNANTRNNSFYAMPVVGGQEYTIKYTTDGSDTQMFAFFYDKNGGCTHSGTYGNYNFAVKNGTGQATFKAPDNSTQMEIRFDNNINGIASFWDIMIYPVAVKTENEVDNWTARPHRQIYAYGASVGTLQTPVRPGYIFGGWKEDTDGDGIGDASAPTGTITSTRTLYSTWTPGTMDVGYDNLFSVSAWGNAALGAKTNQGGTITVDADNGTISIENPANAASNDNNYTPWTYAVPVDTSKEYIFVYDTDIVGATGTQIHIFYKTSAEATTWAGFPNSPYVKTEGHKAKNTIIFTPPEGTTHLSFRFGTTDGAGMTNTFSNIGLYEKAAYDAYAKDYAKVREPFLVTAVTNLMIPTRAGYVFTGWELGDGTEITDTSNLKTNTTVYATWTKEHTVTYYYGDNTTVLATVKVKDGETVGTLPTVTPTKETTAEYSYDFDSWTANGVAFTASTKVTSDLKVYPVFDNVPHTFVWAANTHKNATCDEPALVHKYCSGCGYSLGNVPYDGDNANWLAKGHDYSRGEILENSSTGNTDADTHSIKCARYSTCGSVQLVKHTWTGDTSVGATCTTPGTIKKNCPCGAEKLVDGEIDANAHNFDYTVGTPNGDNENHTVNCTYNPAHTEIVACKDDDNNCYCDICNQELIHVYDEKTKTFEASKADCYNDATYYLTCQCDKKGTETWTDEGSKLKHNWTDTETHLKSDADCENNEVYYKECSLCNVSSKDITGATWTKADTAKGHNYTDEVRNNDNGTHSYLCVNGCGTYGFNKVKEAATDCTYGEWDTTGVAQHVKTCTECSYKLKEEHKFSAWISTDLYKEADGQHSKECSVCNKVVTEDCAYTEESFAETCTTDGFTVHTCNGCNHKYTTADKGKTGHDYTGAVKSYNNGYHNFLCKNGCNTYGFDGITNARTTCTYKYNNNKAGEHQATCTVCNYSFAEECSGGQASCTTLKVCDKCNTEYGTTDPHSFTGTVVQLDGDKHAYLCKYCSTEGLYGVGAEKGATEDCSGGTATCTDLAVCIVCNDTHGELDANAHKWGAWANIEGTEKHKRVCEYNGDHTEEGDCFSPDIIVIAPDCVTPGYTLNTCEICGHEWQTAPTEALGHDWGAWVTNGDGTHTRTCMDETCKYGENGAAKTETAVCTKENADAVVTPPTCTEGGYTTYTCKDCGYVWTDDATAATGHSYAKQTKKTDSKYQRSTKDCTTDWTYWYCCDNCDVSAATEVDKYDDITVLYWVREAAAGHKYDAKTATEDYLATEATCTDKATYYYSCSVCGTSSKGTADEKTFEHGTALNHDWTDTENYLKSEADCINNEVYYKECSRCHISSENETGATWEKADTRSGHDFNYEGGYTAGVAATCTEDGTVEHYTCQTCQKHFKADKTTEIAADKLTIAALKHDFKDIAAKPATCEEDGYTKHKQCQREGCGYRNTDYKVIAAKGHDFNAANGYFCDAENGYHAYNCSNCADYGVEGVEYSVVDGVITGGIKCEFAEKYENYTEDGKHYHKQACICGNAKSTECVDADGAVVTAPTCTADGYSTYKCTVCEYEWVVTDEGSALDHDLEVKSNGDGTHSKICSRECGYKETAERCSTNTPAVNCGTYDVCDVCGEKFGDAKPHVFTNYVSDDNATCTTAGTKTAVCDTCAEGTEKATDTVKDENSPALGHAMSADLYTIEGWQFAPADFDASIIKAPTCGEEGVSISYCSRCSYYITKNQPKKDDAHTWETDESSEDGLKWTVVSGDCGTGITMKNVCTTCGKSQTKKVTGDHTWELSQKIEPTCNKNGYRKWTCTQCEFVVHEYLGYDGPFVLPEDNSNLSSEGEPHVYSPTVVTVPATCTSDKYTVETCLNCREEKITYVEGTMLEHALYTVKAEAPDCDKAGHEAYEKCSNCDYTTLTDALVIPALGHADKDGNGKCDECNDKLFDTDDGQGSCGCICHKENFLMKIIYKILNFFWKLFKIGKSCDCGYVHW